MARPEKVAVVDEVKDRFTAATATVLTEYRGLTVAELAELRAELRKSEAEYKVAKNTLVRIAAKEAGFDVPDDLLSGPTAITFCAGDPVAAAKVLRTFSKDHPALVIKGGILDGELLDAAATLKLADLESREELLAKLAGMMMTIIAQPARLAHASLSKMARLLAAYQTQREEGGETSEAPAEEPAAEAPEEEASPEEAADAPTADAEPSDASEATAEASTETGETVPAADVPDATTGDDVEASAESEGSTEDDATASEDADEK